MIPRAANPVKKADGFIVTPNHQTIPVQTTSTLVVPPNAGRIYLLLDNISDTTINIRLHTAATVNDIHIVPGGNFEMGKEFGNLFTGSVYAIHAGVGSKNLAVLEGVG